MKNVMNAIVTVATTAVITPFVSASAVPERPNSFCAPPSWRASRALSTRWYLVWRKPSRPLPFVRSSR
jgi:hypothetical protein